MSSKTKNTKMALKKWNKEVFGHVQTRISNLKREIEELQGHLPDKDLTYIEQSKQWELEELLKREETLWRDKANARWLGEGDASTHFFYLSMIIHWRYNSIHQILNLNNQWITYWAAIGEEFQQYYNNLFSSSHPSFPKDLQGLVQPLSPMSRITNCYPSQLDGTFTELSWAWDLLKVQDQMECQ